jgi:hypothetical protein
MIDTFTPVVPSSRTGKPAALRSNCSVIDQPFVVSLCHVIVMVAICNLSIAALPRA